MSLALLALLGGCAAPPPLPVTPVGPGLAHLIASVTDDHAHTPPPAPAEAKLEATFQTLDGWVIAGDATPVTADGALHVATHASEPAQVSTRIAARPRTHYRLRGRIQTDRLAPRGPLAQGAAIEVVELGQDGQIVARHDQMLRDRGTTAWHDVSLPFTSNKDAVTLEISLVAGRGITTGSASFDDVAIDALPPEEVIAGWPSRGTSRWARAATVAKDTRPSLALPPGADWRMPVSLSAAGTLRVAVASPAGAACFTIRSGSRQVARACVEARAPWHELSVPLPAGPSALAFESTARIALWGDPTVHVPVPRKQPNLVLILVDTLRADHLGSAGRALAARGIRFDQAHATSSWTAPSVGSLFTSRYPSAHRAGTRVTPEREAGIEADKLERNQLHYLPLSEALPTLAEHLWAGGYETVGLQANFFVSEGMGFDRGFSRYVTYSANDDEGGQRAIPTVEAIVRGRSDNDPPLFLLAHFIDPHLPYRARAPLRAGVLVPHLSAREEPEGTLVLTEITASDRPYPEEVGAMYEADARYADEVVASLLGALDGLPDTVVLLTADHGEGLSEHGAYVHGNSAYEELLHVPLALRLPGGDRAGEVRTDPVSLLDVAPTLLALAGMAADPTFEGQSLLASPIAERNLFFEGMYTGPDRSGVLAGGLKYVRTWPGPTGRGGREELFDLAADPGETRDLLGTRPDEAARLRDAVERYTADNEPGFHVRCADAATFKLTASEAIREVAVRKLKGKVAVDATRRRIHLGLDAGDWVIVRAQRPATFRVERGDAGPCTTWEVAADRGIAPAVGDEVRDELEVLGYLGGDD